MNFAAPFSRLRAGLWFIPLMCVLGGVAVSYGTTTVDEAYDYRLIARSITGGPDAAIQILGTVAASMVSLTALVLTITMVVVQLAMGQFSPRIVQRILQDKPSQLAIGIFVGTFAHAMLALRKVQTNGDGVVPGVAVVVAFGLIVISIMVLVWYVNHIGRALRVSALIELVSKDTRKLLDEVYVSDTPMRAEPARILAPHSGVITRIEYEPLVRIAEAGDCVLMLRPALGEFVPAGATLFEIEGPISRLNRSAAVEAVTLGLERTLEQDMAYGLRLLVDIAERSLSGGGPFLDPTTAVQAIDRLHDCLRQLAPRSFPDGRHRDARGQVRLVTPSMSWEDYVHLSFDEIRIAGSGSPQIARRLGAALNDLLTVAPPARQRVLKEQLDLLRAGVTRHIRDRSDVATSSRDDASGLG